MNHPALTTARERTAELAEMFKLLGDPTRLSIVLQTLGGPISVGTIAGHLALSPSLVSHHLRLLRGARLVRGTRQGKQMLYAIHDDHIRCVIEDMVAHIAEEPED